MLKKLRHIISLGLLLFSGIFLVWASLPSKRQVVSKVITPSEMQLPFLDQTETQSILENRQVKLDWPNSMRIGEEGVITLTFEQVQEDTLYPSQQDQFADIYDNYNIMAEGRYEVAGISIDPANPIQESMPSGQSMRYRWQISAAQAGSYIGRIWLSLRYLPINGDPAVQVPIFVQEVEIHMTSLLGLSGAMARLVGGVGVLLSVLLVFNDMIGWIRLWKEKNTNNEITRDAMD